MPQGVYVAQVISGGGAEKAGIEKGDVITGFDGNAITSMQEIQNQLASKKVGDKVKITVAKGSSNYQESTVEVTLSSKTGTTK